MKNGIDRINPLETSADAIPREQIVIDMARCEIVAANETARETFPLLADRPLPIALDDAMSAVRTLRAIAPEHAAAAKPQPTEPLKLVFWHRGRTVTRFANVKPLTGDDRQGWIHLTFVEPAPYKAPVIPIAPSDPSAQIDQPAIAAQPVDELDTPVVPSTATLAAVVHAPLPGELTDADLDASPRTPTEEADVEIVITRSKRSDTDTLQEIARRIRAGDVNDTPAVADPDPTPTPILGAPSSPPPSPVRTHSAEPPLDTTNLAKLAHELKSPLTAIAAAAEVMRDERLGPIGTPRYADYASDIHHNATHALAVITKMLRPNTDHGDDVQPSPSRDAPLRLNALVKSTVSAMQPLAAERSIALASILTDVDPTLDTDATSLRQIIINLVTNAIKFTPRGGDVRAVTGYLPDGVVYLAIRDTGAGVSNTDIDAAFRDASTDPRSQPSKPVQRAGGGYGLGLPLTINLVRDIGAKIDFDSEPGKGTVVLVAFERAT